MRRATGCRELKRLDKLDKSAVSLVLCLQSDGACPYSAAEAGALILAFPSRVLEAGAEAGSN